MGGRRTKEPRGRTHRSLLGEVLSWKNHRADEYKRERPGCTAEKKKNQLKRVNKRNDRRRKKRKTQGKEGPKGKKEHTRISSQKIERKVWGQEIIRNRISETHPPKMQWGALYKGV